MPAILGGICIMVGFFFGGFSLFLSLDVFELPVGIILLLMLGVPMIGFLLGVIVIFKYGRVGPSHVFPVFVPRSQRVTPEKSFIHEPPRTCPNCKASLSMERAEWVGPLTLKCPYCGATVNTVKREV
jgi:hypothetical protein